MNNEKKSGHFGLMVGAFVAAAAVAFIFTGGSLGGKKTIDGDEDLPPVASQTAPQTK